MQKTSPELKRACGAPPGNQNARTHGFYSRTLAPWQQILRDAAELKRTDRETATMCLKIASIMANDPYNSPVLRHALASLARHLQANQPLDSDQLEDTLGKLTALAGRLAYVEALNRHFPSDQETRIERSEVSE